MRLPFDPVYLPTQAEPRPVTPVTDLPQNLTIDRRRGHLFSLLFKR